MAGFYTSSPPVRALMLALRWSAGPDVVVQSPASDLTLRAVDARGADRALAPVHPAPWLAVLALAVLAPSSVSWAEASSPPLVLEVALVDDPELPPLDDTLVARALAAASDTFAQRFAVTAPRFTVVARFGLESFMKRYAKASSPECSALLAARYKGGGRAELLTQKDAALRFFQRWPLEDLRTFVAPEAREAVKDYEALHAAYMDKYLATLATLESLSTPHGTPLIAKASREGRSHAAWSCALAAQRQFDVIITNTFILADILTEPHPHAVFGKAKVGGIAAPSPGPQRPGGAGVAGQHLLHRHVVAVLVGAGGGRGVGLGASRDPGRLPARPRDRPRRLRHPRRVRSSGRVLDDHTPRRDLPPRARGAARASLAVSALPAVRGGAGRVRRRPAPAEHRAAAGRGPARRCVAQAPQALPRQEAPRVRHRLGGPRRATRRWATRARPSATPRWLWSRTPRRRLRERSTRVTAGGPGWDVVSDRRTLPAAVVPSTAASVPASAPPLEPARTATAAR
jgi:hypothetical protein